MKTLLTFPLLAAQLALAQDDFAFLLAPQRISGTPPIFERYSWVLFDGDSLTVSNATSYEHYLVYDFGWTNFTFTTNGAEAGDAIPVIDNKWTNTMRPFLPPSGVKGLLVCPMGANSYVAPNFNLAVIANVLDNYWLRAQVSNCDVVAFTVTPRTSYGGMTERCLSNLAALNAHIRGSPIPDYLVDTAAEFPNPYDTNVYLDGTHFTPAGYLAWARLIDQAVRGPRRNVVSLK